VTDALGPGDALDRRRFLVGSALGASYFALRAHGFGASRQPPAHRLASLFAAGTSARTLGRAYLADRREERRAAALVDGVGATLPGGRRTLQRASDAELRQLLHRRIADDYAEGRTVLVDGWLLSRTEGRLFALAVLA
jgi:hypothetical protein